VSAYLLIVPLHTRVIAGERAAVCPPLAEVALRSGAEQRRRWFWVVK
jgi:hypothetical protein